MNFIEVLTAFLIFSILVLAFLPIITSLEKLNPIVNLTLTNAVQSQIYGVNADIQQLVIRKDCRVDSWSDIIDEDGVMLIVDAECKGQPLHIGRFVYIGY